MRVLKNQSNVDVNKNVLGKIWKIQAKKSLTINHVMADVIAQDLLTTYGFLKDITPHESFAAPKNDVEVRKVVKKATSKPSKKGVRKPR